MVMYYENEIKNKLPKMKHFEMYMTKIKTIPN